MNDKKLLRANLNDYRSIKKFNSREIDNIVIYIDGTIDLQFKYLKYK